MSVLNHATGELVPIHPEEPGAIAMLNQAVLALTTALDQMPISDVANLKAKVATVATATKELGMSKEAQELAAEAVRRAEWALRRTATKGQESGEIATRESNLIPGGPAGRPASRSSSNMPKARDYFSSKQEYEDANAMGELDQDDFEDVLNEAKAEGNLSRANVARKAREKSKPKRRAKQRDQAETYLNAIESLAHKAAREAAHLTPEQIARVKPKADLWTVGLRESIETLQGLVNSLSKESK